MYKVELTKGSADFLITPRFWPVPMGNRRRMCTRLNFIL